MNAHLTSSPPKKKVGSGKIGAISLSNVRRKSYVLFSVGLRTSGHVLRFSCGIALALHAPCPGVSISGSTRTPRSCHDKYKQRIESTGMSVCE